MTSKVGGGGKPYSIVEGPDGAMWFTMPEANRLGRTTTGDDVTFVDLPSGGRPVFITSGPDGNLWYTKQEPGRIGRVTPAGAVTEFPLNPSNGWPFGIVTGPDGNVWFTEIIGNRVGRITPSGSITTWPLSVGRGPGGIVVGADGALWFSKTIPVTGSGGSRPRGRSPISPSRAAACPGASRVAPTIRSGSSAASRSGG